ncbi:co-chaperone YbbN [Boudabousia marimammalium]|uniref:Thioredoxin domain-containing protein n=1 Tax=Boudabousia marimammalium TaxID=156892 RepID=A0A1Q5PRT6_9ACTO|nr:tetratricopeptide repeat protein [Boudabousia marimammalium]OKL50152.1 hypothetical protein BM477_01790 [Boudabousia marimammalium]
MSQSASMPSTYGAIDLSKISGGNNPPTSSPATPGTEYRVVVDAKVAEWPQLSELSTQVPVVVEFLSAEDQDSAQLAPLLQEAVEAQQGRILLARVDAQVETQLVQAFQVSRTPAVYALVNGRPLPMFEGIVTRTVINQVLTQLLEVSKQAGITGVLDPVPVVDESGTPEAPAEYQAALEARERGAAEEEAAAWKKVLAQYPADKIAQQNLAEAQMRARLQKLDAEKLSSLDEADLLFARGEVEASFTMLLDIVAESDEDREAARERLLEKFTVLGPKHEQVQKARAKLASLLF